MAVEAKRGCGYRKVGGIYLVGGRGEGFMSETKDVRNGLPKLFEVPSKMAEELIGCTVRYGGHDQVISDVERKENTWYATIFRIAKTKKGREYRIDSYINLGLIYDQLVVLWGGSK